MRECVTAAQLLSSILLYYIYNRRRERENTHPSFIYIQYQIKHMIRGCEEGHRREESEEGERKRREGGEVKKLKILKEGKRITYILVRKKESSLLTVEPIITVENGEIRVEKKRITDLEEFYSLIAALKVAVLKFMEKDEGYWRRCGIDKRFWQLMKEHDFIETMEELRDDKEA